MAKAEQNDGRAGAIYERYQAQLRGYINKYTSSRGATDDILHDLFYKFIVTDQEEPIVSVSAWLYRVAKNLIIDRGRKHREQHLPQLTAKDDTQERLLGIALSEVLADDDSSPEMELLRSMVWDELAAALDELPAPQREAFELNELQGVAFDEIARQKSIPINTLISRKRYAVMHLRRRLEALYKDVGLI